MVDPDRSALFETELTIRPHCLYAAFAKLEAGITDKRSVMLVALRLLHYLGFGTVYLLGCDFKMDAPPRSASTPSPRTGPPMRSGTTTCSMTRWPGASRLSSRTSRSTASAW
jgi:hypothetical protein